MARMSRSKTLTSLEGKLGVIRREVQKVLRGLRREIAKRESELARLREEFNKGTALLRGKVTGKPVRARRRSRRARQINWKAVFGSLPPRFTLQTLARHPIAGKRPKAHLYAILSRWKKEKKLTPDPAGGYRKVGAPPRKKPRPRPRPARAPKPAPRPEAPGA